MPYNVMRENIASGSQYPSQASGSILETAKQEQDFAEARQKYESPTSGMC
jgi:hypothetical protein